MSVSSGQNAGSLNNLRPRCFALVSEQERKWKPEQHPLVPGPGNQSVYTGHHYAGGEHQHAEDGVISLMAPAHPRIAKSDCQYSKEQTQSDHPSLPEHLQVGIVYGFKMLLPCVDRYDAYQAVSGDRRGLGLGPDLGPDHGAQAQASSLLLHRAGSPKSYTPLAEDRRTRSPAPSPKMVR